MMNGNNNNELNNNSGKALSVTFLRLLVFIYTKQFANVRWGMMNSVPSSL